MACDARLIEIASASRLSTCIIFHDARRHDPGKIFFNCPSQGKNIHFVDRLFSWMARGYSLFLSLCGISRLFPVGRQTQALMMPKEKRVSARRWAAMPSSMPLNRYRFFGDKLHCGIIGGYPRRNRTVR